MVEHAVAASGGADTEKGWRAAQHRLARRIHDDVIQRLFAVAMALEAGGDLRDAERARCHEQLTLAMGELRALLHEDAEAAEVADDVEDDPAPSLRLWLSTLAVRHPDLALALDVEHELPDLAGDVRDVVDHFTVEALRNARKHACPTRVSVRVRSAGRSMTLEIVNDGVHSAGDGEGLGLRLLGSEAAGVGGRLESARLADGRWRARLTVPTGHDDEERRWAR